MVRGESLVASCRATANPSPVIHWFRGSQLISDGDRSRVNVSQSSAGTTTSSHLTVTRFMTEDAGLYSCLAVNSMGNDSRLFRVNAVGKSAMLTIVGLKLSNLLSDDYSAIIVEFLLLSMHSETQHHWYYDPCQWIRWTRTVS